MHTFNKNQRRIMRGLMTVAAEREAGELITNLRKKLARARLGYGNIELVLSIQHQLDEFEKHLYVDFDNVPSSTRIFRVATLYHDGILTVEDLHEFDDEMWEDFNSILTLFEEDE